MQLEVNKTYLLRNGSRTRILARRDELAIHGRWPFGSECGVTYTPEGRAGENPEEDSDFDIVAESIEDYHFISSKDIFADMDEPIPTIQDTVSSPQTILTGIKHDGTKNRLDLISSIWLNGVASVLTFGAKKYAAHNWRGGLTHSLTLVAALRHIFAFLSGEDKDPETGLSHLYHASCCLMFASELHETKKQLVDDRYITSVTDAE